MNLPFKLLFVLPALCTVSIFSAASGGGASSRPAAKSDETPSHRGGHEADIKRTKSAPASEWSFGGLPYSRRALWSRYAYAEEKPYTKFVTSASMTITCTVKIGSSDPVAWKELPLKLSWYETFEAFKIRLKEIIEEKQGTKIEGDVNLQILIEGREPEGELWQNIVIHAAARKLPVTIVIS